MKKLSTIRPVSVVKPLHTACTKLSLHLPKGEGGKEHSTVEGFARLS